MRQELYSCDSAGLLQNGKPAQNQKWPKNGRRNGRQPFFGGGPKMANFFLFSAKGWVCIFWGPMRQELYFPPPFYTPPHPRTAFSGVCGGASESTVSNAKLSELLGLHRAPGRELSELRSAYFFKYLCVCVTANSPSLLAELTEFAAELRKFSLLKEYSRTVHRPFPSVPCPNM